jgi:ADP-heptose:LPS heptosyltransferase
MFYEPKKLNIGISWFTNNSARFLSNLSNSDLKYISDNNFINLINLQYDADSDQLKKYNIKYDKVVDYKENLKALFSIISSCDYVITIDNCVAHFSGALGLKTYLLLPIQSDWRWFEDTTKSVWYDNVNIYRQQKNGDYKSLITEIVNKIKNEKALG